MRATQIYELDENKINLRQAAVPLPPACTRLPRGRDAGWTGNGTYAHRVESLRVDRSPRIKQVHRLQEQPPDPVRKVLAEGLNRNVIDRPPRNCPDARWLTRRHVLQLHQGVIRRIDRRMQCGCEASPINHPVPWRHASTLDRLAS